MRTPGISSSTTAALHEGLFDAGHHKGVRGYGCQWGGSPATFHHNLLVSNDSRSARINGATNPKVDKNVFLEYQNNVNFNWGRRNSCYGGENEAGEGSSHWCNFVGNYYKPGPAHPEDNVFIELSQARKGKQLTGPSLWYFHDNVMEGQKTKDSWQLISNKTGFSVEQMKQDRPLSKPEYVEYLTPAEPAKKAYKNVLVVVPSTRDRVPTSRASLTRLPMQKDGLPTLTPLLWQTTTTTEWQTNGNGSTD